MQTSNSELIALEKKFWQSMVDEDTETALSMLAEPSFMVSSHGTMKFDHDDFRQMAEHGDMVIKSFKLSDMNVMFPSEDTAVVTYKAKQVVSARDKSEQTNQEMADSSVWTRIDGKWRCVIHTETPFQGDSH